MNMINASELRIGNWINPQFNMKVSLIEPDMVYATFEGNEGDDYEFKSGEIPPIELDPDWLNMFGYKENKRGEYRIDRYELPLVINEQSIYLKFQTDKQKLLEYVHELQNLYFCLNGEELQIKSK